MHFDALQISQILDYPLLADSSVMTLLEVFTDTRKPILGGLFIALQGENFNGDLFAESALEQGAAMAIVQRWRGQNIPVGKAVLEVPDTLLALQTLARAWRSELTIPIVCITGSNGKTSTKDFTRSVLSQVFSVNATQGNFNNHIGLPLSVLATQNHHTAGVFEIGMNHAGELAPLCEIAQPDLGIITNIGTAHIEFLGSKEAIAEEKSTLARCLSEKFYFATPSDCEYNDYFENHSKAQMITVGFADESVRAENIQADAKGTNFDLVIEGQAPQRTYIPVLGKHMVTNALLAAALGWKLGLNSEQISQGLSSVQLTSGRLRRLEWQGIILLDDTYNANPESMQAAINTLCEMPIPPNGKRIAVLGKMGELGIHATEAHRQIGQLAAEKGLQLIAVGAGSEEIAKTAQSPYFPDTSSAADWLKQNAQSGDIVLFKGSRSAAIEKILQTSFPDAC